MTYTEFKDYAQKEYDNGGDIIVAEYDEDDFKEWCDFLGYEPTESDLAELCQFYKDCENATGVRPNRKEI